MEQKSDSTTSDTIRRSATLVELAKVEEFQRIEAEWVTREFEETVRLVQRYRSLYLSAVFISIGWVLGQVINSSSRLASASQPQDQITLDALRNRPDVAAVLCLVPLVNVLFGLLILEATSQIQSLARHNFVAASPSLRWSQLWPLIAKGVPHEHRSSQYEIDKRRGHRKRR